MIVSLKQTSREVIEAKKSKTLDIFHNCPEEQEQQQQSDPKDLGSEFPRSKK